MITDGTCKHAQPVQHACLLQEQIGMLGWDRVLAGLNFQGGFAACSSTVLDGKQAGLDREIQHVANAEAIERQAHRQQVLSWPRGATCMSTVLSATLSTCT
jgi:hypothetical protein